MGVEREDIGHVLVRSDDDDATLGSVDASAVEDVRTETEGAEHLLIVDEPEPTLARSEQRRHGVDRQVSMGLLTDRT